MLSIFLMKAINTRAASLLARVYSFADFWILEVRKLKVCFFLFSLWQINLCSQRTYTAHFVGVPPAM
jgi:hypothetical protein